MSPIHRGSDGWAVGPTWESIVEQKIQDAIEAGEFDNLEGQGRPLQIEENPYAGDWRMGFHLMKNAGVAPPWIELSGDIELRWERVQALLKRAREMACAERVHLRAPLRRQYQRQVAELCQAVEDFNLIVPFVWLQKVPISQDAELAKFDACWAEAEGM